MRQTLHFKINEKTAASIRNIKALLSSCAISSFLKQILFSQLQAYFSSPSKQRPDILIYTVFCQVTNESWVDGGLVKREPGPQLPKIMSRFGPAVGH